MPEPLHVIMAGGGTGGHLYPGLSVAEALQRAAGTVELTWAATARPVDQRLLSQFGPHYIKQPVQPLAKSIGKLWSFWRGWRKSCAYWRTFLQQNPVHCVVALGGYAAGPAAHVASQFKISIVLLNPDALPGMANRYLLKRADLVITQWPLGDQYRAAIKGTEKPLGCPIRRDLTQRDRAEGAHRLGLNPAIKTLVITGASLGAKTINDAMMETLRDSEFRKTFESSLDSIGNRQSAIGPPPWQILHLTGLDQAAEIRAAYAQWPQLRAKVIDYCDDMASVWAVADLAIARAGASTCAELTACGVPSILLPYPYHKDMHQRANALELAQAGAAVIINDAKEPKINAGAIKKTLAMLLYDPQQRDRMAASAKALGKPDAADQIAREILSLRAVSSR